MAREYHDQSARVSGGSPVVGAVFPLTGEFLFEGSAACTQTSAPLAGHFHPMGKVPSKYALEVLKRAKAELPFKDKRDFDEWKKGLMVSLEDPQIKSDDGRVAWDTKQFKFLDQEEEFDSTAPPWMSGRSSGGNMRGHNLHGCLRMLFGTAAPCALVLLTSNPSFAASNFRARGNEPGWSITINDSGIELRTMEGKSAMLSPVPQVQKSGKTETYAGQADGQPFSLVIHEALCTDSMSGMPHPSSVSVSWGELSLSGCGGEPATLLQGDWAIESINGNVVAPTATPELSFDAKGSLTGGGICNRFFGGYELSGEGLTFSGIGSTRMACEQALMEQEVLLLQSLGKVNGFGIGTDGALTLKGAGTAIVAQRK